MNRSSYFFHLISYFSVPASTALRFALRGAHLHLSKGCEGAGFPTIGACEAKPRHGFRSKNAWLRLGVMTGNGPTESLLYACHVWL